MMKFSEDIVPINLDECIELLIDTLVAEDRKEILRENSTSAQHHFDVGMAIRNMWSLWDKKTKLVQWFKKTYGVDHADDISGIILECLWNDIRKEPRKDKELAERFINHWKKETNEGTKTRRKSNVRSKRKSS